mgnify:CR=1 FL=1
MTISQYYWDQLFFTYIIINITKKLQINYYHRTTFLKIDERMIISSRIIFYVFQ